jgi:hypothetical protein
MKEFTFEDELALLEGVREGLGDKWSCARKWIMVHAIGDVVQVFMQPPSRKPMWRHRELILSEIKDGWLGPLGKVVGYEMAVYLNKYERHLDPAAVD